MTLAEFYQYKIVMLAGRAYLLLLLCFEKGVLNANKIIKKIKASELSSMTSVSPYKSKRSIDVSSSAFLFRRAYAIIETKKRALPLRRGSLQRVFLNKFIMQMDFDVFECTAKVWMSVFNILPRPRFTLFQRLP